MPADKEENEPPESAQRAIEPANAKHEVEIEPAELEQRQGEIPPELLDAVIRGDKAAILSIASLYGGPIPPPEMLSAYDEVVPGLAKRIAKNWENQTSHRQSLERRSQLYALTIVILAIAVAPLLALAGASWAAAIVPAAALIGIAGASGFLQLLARSRKDRE